jgi:hypothetical protein
MHAREDGRGREGEERSGPRANSLYMLMPRLLIYAAPSLGPSTTTSASGSLLPRVRSRGSSAEFRDRFRASGA